MAADFKSRLRRRLLGRRFQQHMADDHIFLKNQGNLYYQTVEEKLLAPGFSPSLNSYEFSVFSQNGEDGVILALLSKIGVNEYYFVEIGTGDGRECNSANLILNYGWRGCLIEADSTCAQSAMAYFSDCLGDSDDRVVFINSTASPENINRLLAESGVPANIDCLSIDIDSYDYWIWKAIDSVEPGMVIVEYNASFGSESSVTIPYGSLSNPETQDMEYYHGASLSALKRLGEQKGYILTGCESKGVNAFFVRGDLAAKAGIHAVSPQSAFKSHFGRTKAHSQERQCQMLSATHLEEV